LSDILASPSFLLGAGILVLVALAFLLPPLVRGAGDTARIRRRRNALHELRDELPRAEYEQRMARLDAEEQAARSNGGSPQPTRTFAVLLLVALPLCGAVLYFNVGTPEGIDPRPGQTGELRETLGDLAARVRENPENVDAWNQLGMLWKQIQQFPAAESAFRRVLFLAPDNAMARVELAETLLYQSGGASLPPESESLLRAVLRQNPNNQKALWLAGLGAFHNGRQQQALALWRRLEQLLPEGPVRQRVREQIAQVDPDGTSATGTAATGTAASAAGGAGNLPPGHPPIDAAGTAATSDDAGDAEPASATTPGTDNAVAAGDDAGPASPTSVTVEVSVSPELSTRVSGNETVFVFARAVDGPPAPLAVRRLSAAALPTTIELSESDSMTQGLSITTFPQVRIAARISASGNAIASPGDLQGYSQPFGVAETERVGVTIDQVVE
jgi:cytochrome c-type biogenesis protein CcmH